MSKLTQEVYRKIFHEMINNLKDDNYFAKHLTPE